MNAWRMFVLVVLYLAGTHGFKIATYWGQKRGRSLGKLCNDPSYDIINIGFITNFFVKNNKGFPAMNFAGHCPWTRLPGFTRLFDCSRLAPEIKSCQEKNKKIVLSMGGSVGGYNIEKPSDGIILAKRIWDLFLGGDGPRPFGNAVLDGINLDIAQGTNVGYKEFTTALRDLMKAKKSKAFLLTATVFCTDLQNKRYLSETLLEHIDLFNEIIVKYYQNPRCDVQSAQFKDNIMSWFALAAKNSRGKTRVFVGLIADDNIARLAKYYQHPDKVRKIFEVLRIYPQFGGFMLFDNVIAQNNQIGGMAYSKKIKEIILQSAAKMNAAKVLIEIDSTFDSISKPSESISKTDAVKKLDELASELAQKMAIVNSSYGIFKKNYGFQIKKVPRNVVLITSYTSNDNKMMVFINNASLEEREELKTSVEIPAIALDASLDVVYAFVYRDPKLFNEHQRVIKSFIMSVDIAKKKVRNLSENVTLTFKKIEAGVNEDLQCKFWNFSKGAQNSRGWWSEKGCYKTSDTRDYVTCNCSHLTNFALLLDVAQTKNNAIELQMVTWIGCCLSLAGLVLTLVTYLTFKALRSKLPSKVLINFCCSLALLIIAFLVGLERRSKSLLACKIVAGILQYLVLSTFCWMGVEGGVLYWKLVKIFKTGDSAKIMPAAYAFGWGTPALIVGITYSVDISYFGNKNFCTVIGYGFYFGVLLPVAVILLFNFVMVPFVLRSIRNSMLKTKKTNLEEITEKARLIFGLNLLLGFTWMSAVFALGNLTDIFQWLFCVTNSLQGFFIFVFYTLKNRQARNSWAEFICGAQRKKTSVSSPPTNSNSGANFRM